MLQDVKNSSAKIDLEIVHQLIEYYVGKEDLNKLFVILNFITDRSEVKIDR